MVVAIQDRLNRVIVGMAGIIGLLLIDTTFGFSILTWVTGDTVAAGYEAAESAWQVGVFRLVEAGIGLTLMAIHAACRVISRTLETAARVA